MLSRVQNTGTWVASRQATAKQQQCLSPMGCKYSLGILRNRKKKNQTQMVSSTTFELHMLLDTLLCVVTETEQRGGCPCLLNLRNSFWTLGSHRKHLGKRCCCGSRLSRLRLWLRTCLYLNEGRTVLFLVLFCFHSNSCSLVSNLPKTVVWFLFFASVVVRIHGDRFFLHESTPAFPR